MAEIVRIAEPAEPAGSPSLPQNIEAEAALLGALMIDNRLVEDVQLKLQPLHFFEPLHGRIYESILRMTDANRVANPDTLRPLFVVTRRVRVPELVADPRVEVNWDARETVYGTGDLGTVVVEREINVMD